MWDLRLAGQEMHAILPGSPVIRYQMIAGPGGFICQVCSRRSRSVRGGPPPEGRLYVVDGVRCLHVKGDRLAGQSLDANLHSSPEAQHQAQRRLLLNVVVRQGTAVFELLAGEDQPLLIQGGALLILE